MRGGVFGFVLMEVKRFVLLDEEMMDGLMRKRRR